MAAWAIGPTASRSSCGAGAGGEPGRGGAQEPEEVSRVELRCGLDCHGKPTPPKLVLSGSWSRGMGGLVEDGAAVLEELDPTYTEAELSSYGRLQPGDEALVEVVQDGRDGDAPDRPVRRYTLDAAPYRNAGRAQWVWRLRSQEPAPPGAAPAGGCREPRCFPGAAR